MTADANAARVKRQLIREWSTHAVPIQKGSSAGFVAGAGILW
jgi:hypothetical protein